MTTLVADDFDRSGAIGSNWSVQEGAFTLDGDRAAASSNPGTRCRAIYTGAGTSLESTATGLYRQVEAKVFNNGPNGGTIEAGLIMRTAVAIAGGPLQEEWDFLWTSASGGLLMLRYWYPQLTVTPIVYWQTAFAWTAGTSKVMQARYEIIAGGPRLTLIVDGVQYFQASSLGFTFSTTIMRGIFGYRGAATPGNQDAAQPQFDLFRVSDGTASFNAETAPTCPAEPSLASLSIGGFPTTGQDLPIAPTHLIPEEVIYSTVQEAMESGHVVRWPSHASSIRRVRLQWRGLTDSTLATLRAFFRDTVTGALLVVRWITPEGVTWQFVFDSPLRVTGTGPRTFAAEASGMTAGTDG